MWLVYMTRLANVKGPYIAGSGVICEVECRSLRFMKGVTRGESPRATGVATRLSLAPVRRANLRDQVVTALRNAIIRGQLLPGQKVAEEDIAQELGISRTPVREAVRLLEMQGLIQVEPKIGTFVASPDLEDVRDSLSVRIALESLAARQTIDRLEPPVWQQFLDELWHITAQMRVTLDPVQAVELDIAFHTALVNGTRNAYLMRTWDLVGVPFLIWGPERDLYAGRPKPVGLNLAARHEHLIQALAARDASRSDAAIQQHGEEKLRDIIAPTGPTPPPPGHG